MAIPAHVVALMIREDGWVVSVTRRNKPGDQNLVGGQIEPTDKSPEGALIREAREEAGVEIQPEDLELVFERVDETDGKVAWCYRVKKWKGEPRTCEPGVEVSWQPPSRLVQEGCTFREYNRRLFTLLSML